MSPIKCYISIPRVLVDDAITCSSPYRFITTQDIEFYFKIKLHTEQINFLPTDLILFLDYINQM